MNTMKKVFLILIMALGISSAINAQVTQEKLDNARIDAKEATGELKKEKEKIYYALLDSAKAENAVKAIELRDFVLEADKVTFKYGNWKYVTSNTNFISFSDNKATVQIAFTGAPPGPNGIGGITLEGNASSIEVNTDKKGNTTFSMYVMGAGISAKIDIELIKDTYQAIATVSPNFSSNRFTLSGSLYPTSESDIFKGRSF